MWKIVRNIIAPFVMIILFVYIFWVRRGGNKIDINKWEKIKRDIDNMPLRDVVNSVNEYLG